MKRGSANELFLHAASFALEAHGRVAQERKGADFPYIVHPLRVGEILNAYAYADHVVAAGILHDTMEDTDVTAEQLADAFGSAIAELVVAVSEPDKSLPWEDRKREALVRLEREGRGSVRAVIGADRLDNVRSIRETLRLEGKKAWARFNASRMQQHAHYRDVANALLSHEPDNLLFRALDAETQALFPDKRRTTRFFAGKPLGNPHDARAYLAKPILHWKPQFSAYELAHAWIGGSTAPKAVDALVREALGDYEIVEGFFEKETPLPTRGRPSQTDLLLVLRYERGFAVVAVEGKANETFGPLVREWDDGTAGKRARLDDLRRRLGLESVDVSGLRYQLLHRSVAALIEAERYGASESLVVVYAFEDTPDSFADFAAFAESVGIGPIAKDSLSKPKQLAGVTFRVAWASAPELHA